MPVLISAAMERHAKYVDLKGFFVNQRYGTVTTQRTLSADSSLTPEKSAAGKFLIRNNRNLTGLLMILKKISDVDRAFGATSIFKDI